MPDVTLKFNKDINCSVQVGDIIYYVPSATSNNVSTATGYTNIIKSGDVLYVSKRYIVVNHDGNVPTPSNGDFIMFSKDNMANLSSLLGYYADVKFVNVSTDKAEIFSIGCEVFESSK